MFALFLRRIQKFILPIKVVLVIGSLGALIYLVVNLPPDLGSIVAFGLAIFVLLGVVFSFFLATTASILGALAISFMLFLKAVGLLSILNLGLFFVFLILLGLYLRKP